ncbi:MAG TPA: DoxX family protein [Flavitalea sp.]|nr:DoxX family protein [Flavitalea sp.]
MKKLFSAHYNPRHVDPLLLLVRVVFALSMITHGYPKLQRLLGDEPVQFASVFGMDPSVSLTLAMLAEFGCSLLVLVGLGTRLAVIPLIITMTVIVLHIHIDDPFSKKELPLLHLTAYIGLLVMGAGKYSVDYLLSKK